MFLNLSVELNRDCQDQCTLAGECVSYNTGPPIDNKMACELSNSDHLQHPENLKPRRDWNYRGTKVWRPYNFLSSLFSLYYSIFLCQRWKDDTLELEPRNLLRCAVLSRVWLSWSCTDLQFRMNLVNCDSCLCKCSESPPSTRHHKKQQEETLNVCLATNLRHAQSRFPHPRGMQWTWTHPLGSCPKVDHILVIRR